MHRSAFEHAVAEHVVDNMKVLWQVVILVVFLFSACLKTLRLCAFA